VSKNKYTISDYDANTNLKVSSELWLVMVYFLHPLMLMITSVQIGRGAKNSNVSLLKEAMYPDNFSLFIAIVAALPAILVIFTTFKRKPEASDLIKKLWRNGANFLTASAIISITTLIKPLSQITLNHIAMIDLTHGIQLVIAIGILIFLHTSQRVKDTFADFPQD